jgi:hypothetical protein
VLGQLPDSDGDVVRAEETAVRFVLGALRP